MKPRLEPVFALFLLIACALTPAVALAQQSCESLTDLKLPETTITSATAVPAGPFKLAPVPAIAPGTSTDLPAFCRVDGTIKPTPDSDIRFEVWLPASGWNGRFLQMGNAGFAGMIYPGFLVRPLLSGYAAAATDDGHQDLGTAWAIGHPEKVMDFAYRAVHLTSQRSKDIIKARWVEQGAAPDQIVATKYTDDDPKKGVVMTRPLCPYPQRAWWTGKGTPRTPTISFARQRP